MNYIFFLPNKLTGDILIESVLLSRCKEKESEREKKRKKGKRERAIDKKAFCECNLHAGEGNRWCNKSFVIVKHQMMQNKWNNFSSLF